MDEKERERRLSNTFEILENENKGEEIRAVADVYLEILVLRDEVENKDKVIKGLESVLAGHKTEEATDVYLESDKTKMCLENHLLLEAKQNEIDDLKKAIEELKKTSNLEKEQTSSMQANSPPRSTERKREREETTNHGEARKKAKNKLFQSTSP